MTNLYYRGDNLEFLKAAVKKGLKYDVIYIDPPYNTGNTTFQYQDKRQDWESFMYERLSLIPNIISQRWMVAVSIDDRELYTLKPMLDDILGKDNFKANIAVITSNGANGLKSAHATKTIVKTKEYLLIYSNADNLNPLYKPKKYLFDSHYNKYYDENTNEIKPLMSVIKKDAIFKSTNYNELNIELSNKNKWVKFIELYGKNIYSDSPFKTEVDFDGVKTIKGHLVYKTKTGSIRKLNSFYDSLKEVDSYGGGIYSSVIKGDVWNFTEDMGNIGKEGGVSFTNGKKPLRLIMNILKLFNDKTANVLDFFAGSGTTAEAVIRQNIKDEGVRTFTIVDNNEAGNVAGKRLENIKQQFDFKYTIIEGADLNE